MCDNVWRLSPWRQQHGRSVVRALPVLALCMVPTWQRAAFTTSIPSAAEGRRISKRGSVLLIDRTATEELPGFRTCQLPAVAATAAWTELEKAMPPRTRTLELGTGFYEAKAIHGSAKRAGRPAAGGLRGARGPHHRAHEVLPVGQFPACGSLMRLAERAFFGSGDSHKEFVTDTRVNGMVRRYRPGTGLPRHIDSDEMFEEPILSVVLHGGGADGLRLCQPGSTIIAEAPGAALRAEFGFRVCERPGTAVCLEGPARYTFTHEVPAVSRPRVSLTWRWFRQEFLRELEEIDDVCGGDDGLR